MSLTKETLEGPITLDTLIGTYRIQTGEDDREFTHYIAELYNFGYNENNEVLCSFYIRRIRERERFFFPWDKTKKIWGIASEGYRDLTIDSMGLYKTVLIQRAKEGGIEIKPELMDRIFEKPDEQIKRFLGIDEYTHA